MGSSKQKPLMLKDYLREDQNLDFRGRFSSTHHRWGETTVKCLLDLELCEGGVRGRPSGLTRSRSKGITLSRISAFLKAVKMLTTSSAPKGPKQGILHRSFSKKLLPKTFWRRRNSQREDRSYLSNTNNSIGGGKVLIKDVIRLESFVDETRGAKSVFSPSRPSSPVGSSRNSCSTSGWSEIDSSSGSYSEPSLSSPIPLFATELNSPPEKKRPNMLSTSPSTASQCGDPKMDEIKGEGSDCATCHDYEDKEQLSPVSIMDFPYEEEEETASETAATSPLFHQSLASIERTKQELLEKIRRFEILAHLVDPVDLDEAFSEEHEAGEEVTDDEDEFEGEVRDRARDLHDQVKKWSSAGTPECGMDELLLDFFFRGLYYDSECGSGDSETWRANDRTVEERLLLAAREWVDGMGRKDVASRGALMREMDVDGRWRCVNEVDEGIGVAVEGEVFGSLVDELLLELFMD